MRFLLLHAPLALVCGLCAAQTAPPDVTEQHSPNRIGFVTRVSSPGEIAVQGDRVVLDPGVQMQQPAGETTLYVGQKAMLWGKEDKDNLIFHAQAVVLFPPEPRRVSGSGLIDKLEDAPAGVHRFRADGREFELKDALFGNGEPMTAMGGTPPAGEPAQFSKASVDDIQLNHWVDYSGQQRADGRVEVDYVEFSPNTISPAEARMRRRTDWDAAAVPESAKQGALSRTFNGIDWKRIPPYPDPEMQARVDRIGHSLVPAFQRDLPAGDPIKIDFRFQLVDEPKFGDAVTSPAGVVLVPYQVVDALHNDSQLAAVLADNIASAIEKQGFRARNKTTAMLITQDAAAATLLLAPVASAATLLTGFGGGKVLVNAQEQQSGRVALGLMEDAGYDIRQAPEAWWILANRGDADPHRKPPPMRARNQLQSLGTTWQGARQLPATPPATASAEAHP